MPRAIRMGMVRITREVMRADGKLHPVVSYEKRAINRINGVETVRVDNEDRLLTKYGVRVPYTEVAVGGVRDAANARSET